MKQNKAMKALMEQYSVVSTEDIAQTAADPIWHKKDTAGRSFWGTGNFCGISTASICPEEQLSFLEWEGNEVFLEAHAKDAIPELLRTALGILAFWKKELKEKYPGIPFYLIASYDKGDLQEEDGSLPSMTLRFWADREEPSPIDLSSLDAFHQAIMVEHCAP